MSIESKSRPNYPKLRGMNKSPNPSSPYRIYPGRLINPLGGDDHRYYPSGAIAVDGQRIIAAGNMDEVVTIARDTGESHYEVLDTTEGGERPVIIPGFVDMHTHLPQYRMRGQFRGQLLKWLEEHVFPAEMEFHDSGHASTCSAEFFQAMVKQGDVAGAVYSSVHKGALREAFRAAIGCVVIGNVLMTRNCPKELKQYDEEAIGLAKRQAMQHGASYAVTPRFAPACSMRVMKESAAAARKHGSFIMTHLDEAAEEVNQVRRRFPRSRNYTDVYDRAGMLGSRTIMAHCCHTRDDALDVLGQKNVIVAHCPIANRILDNPRMRYGAMRDRGMRVALGSDVGASPTLNMLAVMKEFLEVHGRAGESVSPTEALYLATIAGKRALCLSNGTDGLRRGQAADFVLLKSPGSAGRDDGNALLAEILAGSREDLEDAVLRTVLAGTEVYRRAH